jgi:hypothetical protein
VSRIGRLGLLAATLACAAGATAATMAEAPAAPASGATAAADEPSPAEQLLFLHPHLASIREPRSVTYDYVAEGGAAPRVADHATLVLGARKDGACCGTHVEFLSGPNAIVLPDLDDPQGNPMLMYFLENEVRLLERTTHGQSAHFRRRIRQALAAQATVQDTSVRWGGKDVAARVVHVAPFLDDPYRARFEREAKTEYDFVLSDAVPGGVVRMTASLAAAGDAPKVTRTLALADPQPAPPARK